MLVEGIQHLDVESRRFVEAANRVVKQDVGVLEEPGRQYEGERNAEEAGLGGDGEKQGKDNDDAGGSTAGGAEEVGDDFQLCVTHAIICGAKALKPRDTHVSALWTISFALTNICIRRYRSVSDNLGITVLLTAEQSRSPNV